jgi:hypothetical protein
MGLISITSLNSSSWGEWFHFRRRREEDLEGHPCEDDGGAPQLLAS